MKERKSKIVRVCEIKRESVCIYIYICMYVCIPTWKSSVLLAWSVESFYTKVRRVSHALHEVSFANAQFMQSCAIFLLCKPLGEESAIRESTNGSIWIDVILIPSVLNS